MSRFDIKRFLFDNEKIEKDLIILLSVFHANANNYFKLEPLYKAEKIEAYYVMEERLIQQTLISTAIILRMIDDRFKVQSKEVKLHYPNVGHELINQKAKNLSFRQACNKIVHANSFYLNTIKSKIEHNEVLNRFVTLKGKKDLWTVNIDIEKYVVNGLCLTKFYDDDWEISTR